MKLKIRTKLLIISFVLLLLMVVSGSYSVQLSRNALREAVGQGSVFLVEDAIARIDKDIYVKMEEVRRFGENRLLQKIAVESNEEFDKIENRESYIKEKDKEWTALPKNVVSPFMGELINNEVSRIMRREFVDFGEREYGYKVYGEVFATNRYGVNITQTGKTSDYYQADEGWWQKARDQGFSVGEIEYDESAEVWTMPLGVRIDDDEGNFLGVIKAIPSARDIIREVELASKKYLTTEMKLIDKDARLIYSTRAFQVFEDVSTKDFFRKISVGSGFFVAKEGGREKLFAYTHAKGFRNFSGLGWTLLIAHGTAEVFSPVRQLERTFAIVSVLLLVFGGFFVVAAVRTISEPIRKLTEGARRIAKGNLDVKIDVRTSDELGELAHSFNKMASALKESYENLERKISERTHELEKRIQELDETAKLLVRRDFELLQANDLLRELDEVKSRFVSIAAHQLRTPLSGIKWTVQMLLDGDFGRVTKEQKSALHNALVTLDRLAKLISDLLNVARIEGGQFPITFSDIHIEEIVRKVFNENIGAAESDGISMRLLLPKKPLRLVSGDFGSLVVVLQNIVENAIAYTPKGGKIEITVQSDLRDSKRVRVAVKDTGMGIPDDQKGLIGEKFFRADNVVREQIPGTGLGLYIVQKILEKHRGALEMESQEGRGSVFSFTLPSLGE